MPSSCIDNFSVDFGNYDLLDLTYACQSQCSSGHRPLFSIKFCLEPPPPSFSSCTWILLHPFLTSDPALLSRSFLGLETKTETWVFRSRDQDRDLGHQVSIPRPWPSDLKTETETWTKWTRVSRPRSRDHNTVHISYSEYSVVALFFYGVVVSSAKLVGNYKRALLLVCVTERFIGAQHCCWCCYW